MNINNTNSIYYDSERHSLSQAKLSQNDILRTLFIFLCYLTYFYALANMYVDYIQPTWYDLGFRIEINHDDKYLIILLLVFLVLLTPKNIEKPSDIVVFISIFCTCIPTLVLKEYGGISDLMIFYTFLSFTIISLLRRFYIKDIVKLNIGIYELLFVFTTLTSLMAVYLIYKIGFSYFSLEFINVYERRDFVSDRLIEGIDGYISQICAQLNLICLAISISYKRRFWLVVNIFIAFILFGFLGHKSQIIWPFILVILSLLFYKISPYRIVIFITVISVIFSYYYIYTGSPLILTAMTYRRLMFIPPLLNQAYFDYANIYGFVYWADSKVGFGIFEYRDTISTANAVGYFISGRTEMHANTGIIGAGYLQYGLAGVLAYSTVIRVVIAFVDGIAVNRNLLPVATLIAMPFIVTALISSDLPATLLSGGLGLAIGVVALLPYGTSGAVHRNWAE